jgi:hypothetical protein
MTELILRKIMLELNDIPYEERTAEIIAIRTLVQKELDKIIKINLTNKYKI